MSYSVLLTKGAARELASLPKDVISRIDQHILALSNDPRPPGHKKLKAQSANAYRIRIGDYRVLYRIDDPAQKLFIYRIGHRRDVYE